MLSEWNSFVCRKLTVILCFLLHKKLENYLLSASAKLLQSCPFLCNPIPCQTPLSKEFSRQEYWSGLPHPLPGDCPNPGIKPKSHVSCIGRQILYHQHHLRNLIEGISIVHIRPNCVALTKNRKKEKKCSPQQSVLAFKAIERKLTITFSDGEDEWELEHLAVFTRETVLFSFGFKTSSLASIWSCMWSSFEVIRVQGAELPPQVGRPGIFPRSK